ncbi:MAG TPA: 3D domain-containing protein [Tepidisphaeraceae bacterium]|nr:3D domain-containing protein [Tepidisphaeraceae bacterium]
MRDVVRHNPVPAAILKVLGVVSLVLSSAAAKAPEQAKAPVKGAATKALLYTTPKAAVPKKAVRKAASAELLKPTARNSAKPVFANAIANRPASIEQTRTVRMEVTAYCPCTKCCGPKAQGITANGQHVSYNDGKFVAADTDVLPFGTRLLIPGYHADAVEVIDRGGAIKGNKLDVFFPTHEAALEWGRRQVDVIVVE